MTRITLPACRAHYPGGSRRVLVSVASPSRAAFPESQAGRHPRRHFRGLLRLHSRYGPLDRSTAQRRPLSQGFGAAGYPAGPLASYQTKPTTVWVEPSSTGDARRLGARRVEEGRGDRLRQLRLPSPLVKPDVRISRIRLSDWLHRRAHGGGPKRTRRRCSTPSAPNTASRGKRLVPCEGTL